MKTVLSLIVMLMAAPGFCTGLFVIPDSNAMATDGYIIVYRAPDHVVAMGSATPEARALDTGASGLGDYALVTIRDESGFAAISEIGEPVYRDYHSIIVRLHRPVPEPFVRPGIHHVQPLRETRAPAQPIPVPMRSGYDGLVAQIVDAVSEDSLISYTYNYQGYLTRYSYSDGYDTACEWSQERFDALGLQTEIQYFPLGGSTCQNVIATQTGTVYPNRQWIICGHLDSISPNPWYDAPGADDNASGSAAVLEAARIMSQYEFEYTVKYILFGGEEQGLHGSAYYASLAASNGDSILGVVNLDMIFYGPPGGDIAWLHYNTASTGLGVAFQAISDTYVPALVKEVATNPTGASDHASFWNNGYAAMLSIERLVWSNPYYHQTTDLIENYLQYFPFGTNMAKAAIATVAYLAGPVGTGTPGESGAPVLPRGSLGVHPNPVSGAATVRITAGSPGPAELQVYDLSGRRVHGQSLDLVSGENTVVIRTGDLPAGLYTVRVTSGGSSENTRMVVVR